MSTEYEATFMRFMKVVGDLERWDHFYRMFALLTTWDARARYAKLVGKPYVSAEAFLSEVAGKAITPYEPSAAPPPPPGGESYPPLENLVRLPLEEDVDGNYRALLEYDDPPVDPTPPSPADLEQAIELADRIISKIHEACEQLLGYSSEVVPIWDALVSLVFDQ